MKTLAFAEHPLTHIASPSPLNPTTPKLRNRIWSVHAKAKGFDRPPANSQKEKNARIEPIRKMSDEKNEYKDDEKIPEVVFERMIGRILFYVGAPLATGIVLLRVFDVLKEQHVWDVPLWFAFLTTFITFGASALGIAYGTLSTSWDAEKKGSLLGFEEAQKNWTDIWREEEE